jgi:hypothetical protein
MARRLQRLPPDGRVAGLGGVVIEETKPLMTTTYERGKADGKLEGKLEDRRETALLLLGEKFGTLSSEAQQRVTELTPEQLRQLLVGLLKAISLEELHLED